MGRAAYVSHEWLCRHHPDPEARQLAVLQKGLPLAKAFAKCCCFTLFLPFASRNLGTGRDLKAQVRHMLAAHSSQQPRCCLCWYARCILLEAQGSFSQDVAVLKSRFSSSEASLPCSSAINCVYVK